MVVAVGATLMVPPVPTNVPPQLLVYHFQLAPVPNPPPCTVRSVLSPGQIDGLSAIAPEGAVDNVLAVTVTETQLVLFQVPSALTY